MDVEAQLERLRLKSHFHVPPGAFDGVPKSLRKLVLLQRSRDFLSFEPMHVDHFLRIERDAGNPEFVAAAVDRQPHLGLAETLTTVREVLVERHGVGVVAGWSGGSELLK